MIELLLLLLLLLLVVVVEAVVLSSTDTGLWWFRTMPGLSERSSKQVSTDGNASLFDNHSSSSSATSGERL